MSNWDQERALHKAKRIGQVELAPVKGGKKRKTIDKPWKVVRVTSLSGKPLLKPVVSGRYQTRELAEAWIAKLARSWYMSRQDQSARATENARRVAEQWAARYRVVGPEDATAAARGVEIDQREEAHG